MTGWTPAPSSRDSSFSSRAQTAPSTRLLAIYLRHHAAASAGGLRLFQRSASGQSSAQVRDELAQLAVQVAEDRRDLLGLLSQLSVSRPRLAELLAVAAEMAGRVKLNGTVMSRSPLSDLVELEALCVAVEAKRLGWVTLRILSDADPRLEPDSLDALIERAGDQRERLEQLRRRTVAAVLVDEDHSSVPGRKEETR